MKSQVLYTVWCYISSEAAEEVWFWSLLGVKGLTAVSGAIEPVLQKKVSPPHLCIQRPGHISHNRKVVYCQPGKSLSESKQADWDDWQRDVTCSVRPGHDFRYPPAKLHASPDIRAAPRPISSPSNLKRLALEIVPLKCWSTHHDGAHNASCVDSRLIAHTFV